ncbi:cholesterol esterase [Streptomyces fructofermentans]|uniref:Cholesterol esterase n=2 Tax=Streptomyces fructofermentans TaxID=152141 RepID=A0A918KWN0_9ACTN|nr:cholesterol esterase [Streptomyces fructofermentans]
MLVPCTLAVGALGIAIAQGALAASFAVSGSAFKVSASEITAEGVSSFPSSVGGSANDARPVLLAGVKSGTVSDVCVSLKQRLPLVGDITMLVRSGADKPLEGTNLVVNADALTGGGGRVTGVEAGRDASTLTAAPGVTGPRGTFGVQASTAVARDVRSTAYAANGGTLTLEKLEIEFSRTGKQCF